jgi:hypothetical protein
MPFSVISTGRDTSVPDEYRTVHETARGFVRSCQPVRLLYICGKYLHFNSDSQQEKQHCRNEMLRVHFECLSFEEASRQSVTSGTQRGNLRRSAEVGGTPKDDAARRE